MEKPTCRGFSAGAAAAGLKKRGALDLGMIVSEVPAAVAAVFTRNRVQAAPVLLDRERIRSGRCRAVIANAGNANCCTGKQGMANARAMARHAADALGIAEEAVLVASTGVIGQPLDIGKVERAVPGLAEALSETGLPDFAVAIMTTDLVPKIITRTGTVDGKAFTVTGVAKGSGMIRPDMATMLCFVCTDAEVAPGLLQDCLAKAADRSFNRITVDGDTSTNDTILVMANGLSGASVRGPASVDVFQGVLDDVLLSLAKMVVQDGEGATKLVEVAVRGAASADDARRVADTVAGSSLVKTALFGEDANWGRIIAAAGRAGADLDPDRIDIFFDGVRMVADGVGLGPDAEARATEVLRQKTFSITVDLNLGRGSASVFTCDFSVEYVRINADYRS